MAETQLQAAIVAYLRSKLSSVKEPDSLAVGINCILEAFELSDKAVNSADVQSLLAAFSGESSSPAPQSVEGQCKAARVCRRGMRSPILMLNMQMTQLSASLWTI